MALKLPVCEYEMAMLPKLTINCAAVAQRHRFRVYHAKSISRKASVRLNRVKPPTPPKRT